MPTRIVKTLLPAALCTLALVAAVPALADATADLHALFDREFQRDHREQPLNASFAGDQRYSRDLPDDSPAFEERSHAGDLEVLKALEAIPRASLTPASQLNYDLFRHEYQDRLALYPFKAYLYSDNQRGGVHTLN
ncbi:MAG: hypothetical protein ACRETU_06585, partial [Steroidobacterales bacterium]